MINSIPSTPRTISADNLTTSKPAEAIAFAPVAVVTRGKVVQKDDALVVEEPLAIVITHGPAADRRRFTLSVTMRTPGHDRELAVGLLVAEAILFEPDQILGLELARAETSVRIDLHPEVVLDLGRLARLGMTSSACGICGKTSIAAIESTCAGPRAGGTPVPARIIYQLSDQLRQHQVLFARTGGIHAAALFDREGRLLSVREDVGRHNAVDKLIGAEFLAGNLPLDNRMMLVSGRAGFELIQKAAMASVPIFAAVGAPSSLAVALADRLGLTLIGFLREDRFNIYAGAERIAL